MIRNKDTYVTLGYCSPQASVRPIIGPTTQNPQLIMVRSCRTICNDRSTTVVSAVET